VPAIASPRRPDPASASHGPTSAAVSVALATAVACACLVHDQIMSIRTSEPLARAERS
jgi:hypothetical protein